MENKTKLFQIEEFANRFCMNYLNIFDDIDYDDILYNLQYILVRQLNECDYIQFGRTKLKRTDIKTIRILIEIIEKILKNLDERNQNIENETRIE